MNFNVEGITETPLVSRASSGEGGEKNPKNKPCTNTKFEIKRRRQRARDSRRLGVYRSGPLAVVDDEAPRYHRCAVHFNRHRHHQVV